MIKSLDIGRRNFKKRKYKIYVGKIKFIPLKKKRSNKTLFFKDYKKANQFIKKIKKKGGKAYLKKA